MLYTRRTSANSHGATDQINYHLSIDEELLFLICRIKTPTRPSIEEKDDAVDGIRS
jgi:hypothetical protein